MKRLIFLFLIICSNSSSAFDVNGLKYLMPKETALKTLQLRHDSVIGVKGGGDTFLAISNQGSSEAVTFCNEQLVSYQQDFLGDIKTFIRLVEKETILHNYGIYEAKSQETSVGEWGSLSVKWQKGPYSKEIGYSVVADSDPQIYARYFGLNRCE